MEFYSRSNKPKSEAQTFTEFEPTYKMIIDEQTGKEELKKTGKTNVYEKIQQYKDECDIYKILERYEKGDSEALNRIAGVYADTRQMPNSLAQAQQMIIDAEQNFYELPIELRKEFNNSTKEFIAAISNGTASKVFEKYYKQKDAENGVLNVENQPNNQNDGQPQNNEYNQNGGVKYE